MILAFVLFYASFLLFTVFGAFYHRYLIEVENKSPNHKIWTLYRAGFFTGNAFLFSTELVHIAVLVFHQSSIYWILFDALLNKLRGLPTLYIGKTSAIDKYFNDKESAMFSFKIGFLVLSICLCIIFL